MKNPLRCLYGVMVVITLTPIWSVHYLPTQDGASHLYNSWLLRELVHGDGGIVAQTFRIDWRPHPNWIGSVVMALLMTVVPPLVAEKLLVTGFVVLFLIALDNYEASAGYFPIAYRPDVSPPDNYTIEFVPAFVNVETYARRAEYVFTWQVGPDSPLWPQLQRHCVLISDNPPGRVWRSRFESRTETVQTTLSHPR